MFGSTADITAPAPPVAPPALPPPATPPATAPGMPSSPPPVCTHHVAAIPRRVRFITERKGGCAGTEACRVEYWIDTLEQHKLHIVDHVTSNMAQHVVLVGEMQATYSTIDPRSEAAGNLSAAAERYKGECVVTELGAGEAFNLTSHSAEQDGDSGIWLFAGFELSTTADGCILTFDGGSLVSMEALSSAHRRVLEAGQHKTFELCSEDDRVAYDEALAAEKQRLQEELADFLRPNSSGTDVGIASIASWEGLGCTTTPPSCAFSWCGGNSGGGCDYTPIAAPDSPCPDVHDGQGGTPSFPEWMGEVKDACVPKPVCGGDHTLAVNGRYAEVDLDNRVKFKCGTSRLSGHKRTITTVMRKTTVPGSMGETVTEEPVPVCHGDSCSDTAEADQQCASHDNGIWPWHNTELSEAEHEACWDALNVQPTNPGAESSFDRAARINRDLNCGVSPNFPKSKDYAEFLSCQVNKDLVYGLRALDAKISRNSPSLSCGGWTTRTWISITNLIFRMEDCLSWKTKERKRICRGPQNMPCSPGGSLSTCRCSYEDVDLPYARWEIDKRRFDQVDKFPCHPKGCYKSERLADFFRSSPSLPPPSLPPKAVDGADCYQNDYCESGYCMGSYFGTGTCTAKNGPNQVCPDQSGSDSDSGCTTGICCDISGSTDYCSDASGKCPEGADCWSSEICQSGYTNMVYGYCSWVAGRGTCRELKDIQEFCGTVGGGDEECYSGQCTCNKCVESDGLMYPGGPCRVNSQCHSSYFCRGFTAGSVCSGACEYKLANGISCNRVRYGHDQCQSGWCYCWLGSCSCRAQ